MRTSAIVRFVAVVGFSIIAPVVARATVGHALPLNQYQAGTENTTLITNGNFENGTTGFSVGGDGTVGAPINPPNPASTVGNLAFQAGSSGSLTTLSPIALNQNTQYVISGYLWDFGGFSWVSAQDAAASTGTTELELFENSGQPYFMYTDPINGSDFPNGLVLSANGSSLGSLNNPIAQIDNLAVTPVSQFTPPTPEPTIIGVTVLSGMLLLRRSRRSRAAVE